MQQSKLASYLPKRRFVETEILRRADVLRLGFGPQPHSGKAAVNAPQSRRFAKFRDARQSRSVWSARVFSTAFSEAHLGKRAVVCRRIPEKVSMRTVKRPVTRVRVSRRDCVIQPSVAARTERLRWGTNHKFINPDGVGSMRGERRCNRGSARRAGLGFVLDG